MLINCPSVTEHAAGVGSLTSIALLILRWCIPQTLLKHSEISSKLPD